MEGNLYKGVVALMIQGLKKSISFVIKALPETKITGEWLAQHISECISCLSKVGSNARAVVTDNHSPNVNAFNCLLYTYGINDPKLFIQHPDNNTKTYLFFDNVHLMKNVRNNLFNAKKFVCPSFTFDVQGVVINSPDGYISWSDLYSIYDQDSKLPANLRKANKLTYRAIHSGNNKQSVNLALAIFHESTIAASKSYFPERKDISGFLSLIHTWWTIVNSRDRFCSNQLGNAVIDGDGKTDFFLSFAEWLNNWAESPVFCLTTHTSDALIRTVYALVILVEDLLNSGYEYVILRKLQSDPLEKRFSMYRQMSDGRFLVSLREVLNSERILQCRSLLKENVNIWEDDVAPVVTHTLGAFINFIEKDDSHLCEAALTDDSNEVATTIAGYTAKELIKRSSCIICKSCLVNENGIHFKNKYFDNLSRGGLTIHSFIFFG